MTIYVAIAVVIVILGAGLTGIENWGTLPWLQGVGVGLAFGVFWWRSSPAGNSAIVSVVKVVAGLALLVAIAMGMISDLRPAMRVFFNGMSLAVPVGAALMAWWRWDRVRPALVVMAKVENVHWLLRLLGESRNAESLDDKPAA